jgi:hypothetical protein
MEADITITLMVVGITLMVVDNLNLTSNYLYIM